MNYEEAIAQLQVGIHIKKEEIKNNKVFFPKHDNSRLEEDIEVYETAISALEKQIPKKPIMKQCFDDLDSEYLCCPACGEILTDRIPFDNKDFYFHCMNCGQKFDWSDVD